MHSKDDCRGKIVSSTRSNKIRDEALSEILQTRRLRLAGHVAYSTTIA